MLGLFNITKWKVTHFGHKTGDIPHITLGSNDITLVWEQRDLDVVIHESLKHSDQCAVAAKSVKNSLGLIKAKFHYAS